MESNGCWIPQSTFTQRVIRSEVKNTTETSRIKAGTFNSNANPFQLDRAGAWKQATSLKLVDSSREKEGNKQIINQSALLLF